MLVRFSNDPAPFVFDGTMELSVSRPESGLDVREPVADPVEAADARW
jgi:hypothetical protein